MNRICPMCGRPLKASGDCIACGGPKKESIGIIGSLAVTAITIAVIGMSVVGFNKLVGNPFEILGSLKSNGTGLYKVTLASENLPVSNEPQNTITINQFGELREYFENRQFEALNAIFEEYQEAFENNSSNEYKLYDAYQVFSTTLPSYEDLFDDWLEHSAGHYIPYLARAHYYNTNGWESRGYGWAKDTSDEQFSKMRLYFQKAHDDVEIALSINQNLLPAYMILIGICNATADKEGEEEAIRNALQLFPESFLVRSQYMHAIQPRWGGSYSQMEYFAKQAEEYSDVNSHLPFLYGYIYCDQAKIFAGKKQYKEAVELYTKAMAYGDFWYFYEERASAYYHLEELDKALDDVEQSIYLRPTIDRSYRLRSKISFRKGDIESALADLHTAQLLKPADSATQRWKEWAAKNYLNQGHKVFKNDLNLAVEKYNIAAGFDPEAAEIYYWRGVAYYRLKQFEHALEDLETSIELNPHHFDSYLVMDYVLLENKEWDKIIRYWDQFLLLEPGHDRAYLERAGTYYHNQEYAKSLADLKAACDLGNEEGCKRYDTYKNKWQ
ncbi:MAG: tetratricopeptide repeat protein [Desulfobacterales bacterium]|nr:MAG: tetratricopeptide repeat protein [Desulfobacterales bacterium]